jgi:hypothetical protein
MANDLVKKPSSELSPMEMGIELFKLRQLKKEAESRIKIIQSQILEKMKELELEQVKTKSYTLYRTTYPTWKVTDDEAATEALKEKKIPVYTKVALDMSRMKLVLDGLCERGEAVDGIEYGGRDYVGIRESKKVKKDEQES